MIGMRACVRRSLDWRVLTEQKLREEMSAKSSKKAFEVPHPT